MDICVTEDTASYHKVEDSNIQSDTQITKLENSKEVCSKVRVKSFVNH